MEIGSRGKKGGGKERGRKKRVFMGFVLFTTPRFVRRRGGGKKKKKAGNDRWE